MVLWEVAISVTGADVDAGGLNGCLRSVMVAGRAVNSTLQFNVIWESAIVRMEKAGTRWRLLSRDGLSPVPDKELTFHTLVDFQLPSGVARPIPAG